MFYICRMSKFSDESKSGLKEVYVAKRQQFTPIPISSEIAATIKIDIDLQEKFNKAIGDIVDAKYQIVLEVVRLLVGRTPLKSDYRDVTLRVFEHYTEMLFKGDKVGRITETKNDEGLVNGWLFEPLDNSKTPD